MERSNIEIKNNIKGVLEPDEIKTGINNTLLEIKIKKFLRLIKTRII